MDDRVAVAWDALSRRAWEEALALLEGMDDDPEAVALQRDLVELAGRFDRLDSGDAIAIPATYTEAVAVTR